MTTRLPLQHESFLEADGRTVNRFFYAYLRSLQQLRDAGGISQEDFDALTNRVTALEALRLYGTGGINVSGSLGSGYRIHYSGDDSSVLAAQIFGG